MILLIDNYDSFTYNLAQYIGEYTEVVVCRNDEKDLHRIAQQAQGLVFSPGPGWPKEAGEMESVIADFAGEKPMLGICLGHQAIAETFGGSLRLAKKVMHGKQSEIELLRPCPLYEKGSSTATVMRYHSIVIDRMPPHFEVVARSQDDGEIMAIQHEKWPIYGVQYHPESIGTPDGKNMIWQFIQTVEKEGKL